jgi:predicted 2-oxoglutarate/Fe(II)-dependent dioxygenase YbiX
MRNEMEIHRFGAGVFTITGFLSQAECAAFIGGSEKRGYSEAGIRTEDGELLYKEARNNDRVVFDDASLAQFLFERARPLLPAEIDGWRLCGFNDRFRYYRYSERQQFDWHLDGTVRVVPGRESFLTFMMYLNDDFEGGSTEFGWEKVAPLAGMALVFPHRVRHRGAPVDSGLKYVLRTDVMYEGADV